MLEQTGPQMEVSVVSPFHAFGPSHLAALAVFAVLCGCMIAMARSGRWPAASRFGEHLLATVLVLLPVVNAWYQANGGSFDFRKALPFHYCDFAAFAGAAALWTRGQWPSEICYFFGLAGTFQGLVTPALQKDFPDPAFFVFFLNHGLVVVTSLYVVLGLRVRPLPGAVWRAMAAMVAYAAFAGAVNAVLGANFGFLCEKSPNPSLLDHLGPWPWYVASLFFVGLVLYSLLYLPFWIGRRGSRASG